MGKIGFIGLGNMGLPMAKNLVDAGNDLQVFDMVPAACEAAAGYGMRVCDNAVDAATQVDIIITMLPSGPIVLSVFDEIVPVARVGCVIIDCSTIDVASANQAHLLAKGAGIGCLDAPVSGGIGGAAEGTLTFMIGGEAGDLEKTRAVLEIMGARLVHCGKGGSGQAAKICNNMLLGISMIGACEAFVLAEKLGLDQQALFDVVSTSSGSCWSVNTYCPVPGVGPRSPADNDYKPGFAAALMLKDLKLSQQAATDCGAATPMGAKATRFYDEFVQEDLDGADFSAVINSLRNSDRS